MECDHATIAMLSKTSKTGSSRLMILYETINYMTSFMSPALFSFLPQGSRSEEPGDTEDNRERRGSDQDICPGAGATMTAMVLKVSHSRTDSSDEVSVSHVFVPLTSGRFLDIKDRK